MEGGREGGVMRGIEEGDSTSSRTAKLTGLLVGDLVEAILKDLVEMHRLVVTGRHVFTIRENERGCPWSRRVGTVSRCGRARSHPPPGTVTHTTEGNRFTDGDFIPRS